MSARNRDKRNHNRAVVPQSAPLSKRDAMHLAAKYAEGKTIFMHRVIAEAMGIIKPGDMTTELEFVDGDSMNNRRANIRRRELPQGVSAINIPIGEPLTKAEKSRVWAVLERSPELTTAAWHAAYLTTLAQMEFPPGELEAWQRSDALSEADKERMRRELSPGRDERAAVARQELADAVAEAFGSDGDGRIAAFLLAHAMAESIERSERTIN